MSPGGAGGGGPWRDYRLRAVRWLLWSLLILGLGAPSGAQEIFVEDFEVGNLFRWSLRMGEAIAPAEVFRLQDLDLRDPHVYLDLTPFGCFDFTDQELPFGLGPSLNARLQSTLESDVDPADGRLDASYLLAFRPFAEDAAGERLDLQSGDCAAPESTTSCVAEPGSVPQTVVYDGVDVGLCLAPLPGTTGSYSPAIVAPAAPGFVSAPRALPFGFGGVALPLRGARIGARFVDTSIDHLGDGLMAGFLAESDADQILLPADLPVVGGEPFSILLPGGSGNCAAHDDRDQLDGVSGWWFYFAFPARRVPFTE